MARPIVDMHSWNAPENSLQALYNWYQTGGDEGTDEDTIDTYPATGGITNAYTGGGGGDGAGYVPDYGNPYYMEDDEADPFFMQREDPNLLQRFGIGAKNFLGGITGAFPNMINRAIGRPPDATYSYPGDVTGYGSRAGITHEELRNMELLEQMGGINEKGQDIYGINVVSGFGDYTAYNEKRVTELEEALAAARKNYSNEQDYLDKTTRLRKELEDRTGLQTGIDEDEAEMDAMIMKKEIEARRIRKGLKDKKDTLDITPTGTGIIPVGGMLPGGQHETVAPAAPSIQAVGGMLPGGQHEIAAPVAPTPVYTGGIKSPAHPSNQGGGGQAAADRAGGSWDYSPFRKGGRVRYGTGGIVDLL